MFLKLCTNLVSINKFSQNLNCKITFKPFHDDFQNENSEKMIEHVEAINELYYLDALGKSFSAITIASIHKI